MDRTASTLRAGSLALLLLIGAPLTAVYGQGTAFTIQSRLMTNGTLAHGYYDFVFTLYNAAQSGTAVAGPATNLAVFVTNGLFETTVDFGAAPWTGQALWLSTSVRAQGNGPFTVLTSREPMTPSPYAITASNLSGTVSASQIGGVLPNSALPANPVFSGTVTAGGGYSGNGAALTNVTANAVAAAVTNGIAAAATNVVPTRAEISSSVVVLPSFTYDHFGMYLLLSADGGRTYQNPLTGYAYNFADMAPNYPDSWTQDFCVTYWPSGGNDLWLATFTAAFGYSSDRYWTNHWPLLVSSNFYEWHYKAAIPFTNSVTGGTNSYHCWVTQWLNTGDGLPHLIYQAGTAVPPLLYETHPLDGSLTNWSPPVAIQGDFYANFSYDCTFFPVGPPGLPPSQVTTWGMLYKPAYPQAGWSVALALNPLGPYMTSPTNEFAWVPWFGWATNLAPPLQTGDAPEGPWVIQLPDGRWRVFGFYNTLSDNSGLFYSDSQDANFLAPNWSPDANAVFNLGLPPGTPGTNGGHSVGYVPGPAELSKILANLAEYRNLGLTAPGVRVPELSPGGWGPDQTAQITLSSSASGPFQRNDAFGEYYDLTGEALSAYRFGWNGIAGPNSQVYLLAHEGNGITLDLGLANTNAWYATTLTIHTNGPETNALWVPHGNVDLGDQLTVRGPGGITNLSLAGGGGFVAVDSHGREVMSTDATRLLGFTPSQITAALGYMPPTNTPAAISNLIVQIGTPFRGQVLMFNGSGIVWSNPPQGVMPLALPASNAPTDARDAQIRMLESRVQKLEQMIRQQGHTGQ